LIADSIGFRLEEIVNIRAGHSGRVFGGEKLIPTACAAGLSKSELGQEMLSALGIPAFLTNRARSALNE
jgi:hypothetical protein